MAFDHEKLDVYRLAIEFVARANDLIERLPRGRGYLADQLQRAALSIVLNIAEGAWQVLACRQGRLLHTSPRFRHRERRRARRVS